MTSNDIVSSDGWELSQILGSGGFGTVQLWVHAKSGKKVALKQCKWSYSQLTPIQRKRWITEVDIMKNLKHPNIVRTGCIPFKLQNAEENLPILCMEYCKKGDLRKILNQPENCCGLIEIEAIKVMTEVSNAVEYLHSLKITHRDLKPENIVLQNENNMLSYKLIDLGYAKELGDTSTSASLVGTLNYVAPELLYKEKYSCSVDYWSLGILFYELVTGARPFLPTMQHTMEWMKHIQNKNYDDICVYESGGEIIFGKDIQDPTHLSNCIRSKMVQWFRLVLQWNPHKRGKILDESGRSHLAVFTTLRHALSKKVLYVFYMTFYKINTYEVDDTTTIKDLQLLIERDTNIKVKHQVLTSYKGVILTESTASIISQTNDSVLFVFKDDCCFIEDVSLPCIPKIIEEMMTHSKDELALQVLKDYYRYTIYFTKKQVYLFELYLFAFSINVDLLHQRINTFSKNMEETFFLEKTKALMNQMHTIRLSYTDITNGDTNKKRKTDYFDKVDKLYRAVNQIKVKFDSLKDDYNRLRTKAESVDYISDLRELYDKMCNVYLEFTKEELHKSAKPIRMVKLLFSFLEAREEKIYNKNIIDIVRQTDKLRDELSKLEIIFNSVTVMTQSYSKEFQKVMPHTLDINITSQQSEENHQSLNISTSELCKNPGINLEDKVIYENLVMRYTLENLMTEMQKNILK